MIRKNLSKIFNILSVATIIIVLVISLFNIGYYKSCFQDESGNIECVDRYFNLYQFYLIGGVGINYFFIVPFLVICLIFRLILLYKNTYKTALFAIISIFLEILVVVGIFSMDVLLPTNVKSLFSILVSLSINNRFIVDFLIS